jgi:hypothetical protein
MFYDFDNKKLKNYKEYEIDKCWRIDSDGNRIKKFPFFYNVSDEEDYVGEEFATLEDAKKFIDSLK